MQAGARTTLFSPVPSRPKNCSLCVSPVVRGALQEMAQRLTDTVRAKGVALPDQTFRTCRTRRPLVKVRTTAAFPFRFILRHAIMASDFWRFPNILVLLFWGADIPLTRVCGVGQSVCQKSGDRKGHRIGYLFRISALQVDTKVGSLLLGPTSARMPNSLFSTVP